MQSNIMSFIIRIFVYNQPIHLAGARLVVVEIWDALPLGTVCVHLWILLWLFGIKIVVFVFLFVIIVAVAFTSHIHCAPRRGIFLLLFVVVVVVVVVVVKWCDTVRCDIMFSREMTMTTMTVWLCCSLLVQYRTVDDDNTKIDGSASTVRTHPTVIIIR